MRAPQRRVEPIDRARSSRHVLTINPRFRRSRRSRTPKKSHEIAQRTRIPTSFLEQIMSQLRGAGIVRSERGPRRRISAESRPEGHNSRAGGSSVPGPAGSDLLRHSQRTRTLSDGSGVLPQGDLGRGARRHQQDSRANHLRDIGQASRRTLGRDKSVKPANAGVVEDCLRVRGENLKPQTGIGGASSS